MLIYFRFGSRNAILGTTIAFHGVTIGGIILVPPHPATGRSVVIGLKAVSGLQWGALGRPLPVGQLLV